MVVADDAAAADTDDADDGEFLILGSNGAKYIPELILHLKSGKGYMFNLENE